MNFNVGFLLLICCVLTDQELDHCDVSVLSEENLRTIEADSFWCFSKLMDSIQDNYTFAQPGIQVKVNALKDLVSRIDSEYMPANQI